MVGIEQSRLLVNTPGLEKEERATLPAGPGLKGIREPRPSPHQVAKYPGLDDNLRVPYFIIYLLSKPARPRP